MGLVDSPGPETSKPPPPPWWTIDGAEIPLESLETDPLPDGTGPDDIKKLHDLVRFLARENRLLRERLEQELKHRYGSNSEKRPRGNKNAPDGEGNASGGSGAAPGSDSTGPSSSATAAGDPEGSGEGSVKKPGHSRRRIPPDLPTDEIELPLDDESCKRCHGPIHRLERVESYRFHYVPGHIRVRVLVRWRCACDDPTCDGPFQIAKLPPEPIPKGRATAGFLAHLLVTKFADHCPIYRFRKILLRQKVDLPLSTLVDYCKKSTELLKPLWEIMRQEILKSAILQTDDTHIRVRLPRQKGVLKGHLWAYRGDEAHPYVVFEFTPDWQGKAPQDFLKTFRGYVQADAYKGYDALFKDGTRIEVGCMAHARRKWVAAQASSPQVAGQALELIGRLYAIEEECREVTPEQRRSVRQERSVPILESFRVWMEGQKARVLPKSPVATAIEYAQNQWAALVRFCEDGRLNIDNNAVERELRAVALGRKNWMAAGGGIGGETAAIGYTMVASALACGVNPVEWLGDVLEQIVTCPPDRLHELLPDSWKRDRAVQRPEGAAVGTNEGVSGAGTPTPAPSPVRPPADAQEAAPPDGSPPDIADHGLDVDRQQEPIGRSEPRSDGLRVHAALVPPATCSFRLYSPIEERSGPSAEDESPPARAPP